MKQAYGYIRTATVKQAEEPNSLIEQRRRIVGYCVANNLKLVSVFSDSAKSGKNPFKNNSLGNMLSVCRKKDKIDAIVVTDWDRLSRDSYDLYILTGLLAKKGIKLIVLNELNDNYEERMLSIRKPRSL